MELVNLLDGWMIEPVLPRWHMRETMALLDMLAASARSSHVYHARLNLQSAAGMLEALAGGGTRAMSAVVVWLTATAESEDNVGDLLGQLTPGQVGCGGSVQGDHPPPRPGLLAGSKLTDTQEEITGCEGAAAHAAAAAVPGHAPRIEARACVSIGGLQNLP
eukprot:m.173264 g.173264  ORF g.173264 m.173264 type:complete len:162 (-) comp9951_c0_seq12:4953-5438(-)